MDVEHRQVLGRVDRGAEGVRARPVAAGEQVRGILAFGHPRDPQPQRLAADRLRPQHRLAPRAVGVQGQHRLLRVGREQLHLLRRDRGAHDRDGIAHPGLMAGDHVRVSLDHQRPSALHHLRPRPLDPVQRAPLRIQLALGRVDVLRLLVGQQRPRPKPLNAPARVSDREHDPGAEAVVMAPALLAAQDQAGRLDLLDRIARLLTAEQDRVPGPRRAADPELGQRLGAQPAAGEVVARLRRLRRVTQEGRVEARRALEQLGQPGALLARLLGPRILGLALELDPVAVRQRLHRVGEREPLLLLDELDHVAPHPAAEAVVELLRRVDRERGRTLVVKRTEAGEPGAGAAQVGVRGDHLDDVRGLLHPLHRSRREQRHQPRPLNGGAARLRPVGLRLTGRPLNGGAARLRPVGLRLTASTPRAARLCGRWRSRTGRSSRRCSRSPVAAPPGRPRPPRAGSGRRGR